MGKTKYISPDIKTVSLGISSMLMSSDGISSNEGISGGGRDDNGHLVPAAKKGYYPKMKSFDPWTTWDNK